MTVSKQWSIFQEGKHCISSISGGDFEAGNFPKSDGKNPSRAANYPTPFERGSACEDKNLKNANVLSAFMRIFLHTLHEFVILFCPPSKAQLLFIFFRFLHFHSFSSGQREEI